MRAPPKGGEGGRHEREKERRNEKKKGRDKDKRAAAAKKNKNSLSLQILSARVTQHVPSSFSRAHERKRRLGEEEEELQTHVTSHETVEKSHAFVKAMKR